MSHVNVTLAELNGFKTAGDICLPFNLKVGAIANEPLECTEVLRFLCGKRLVCKARYQGSHVVVKIFFGAGFQKRSQREFDGVQRIKKASISTPTLLHYINEEEMLFSLLMFEFIEQSTTLSQCVDETSSDKERISVFEKALVLIAGMHSASIYQEDVHLDNFLHSHNELYLIDGDQVKSDRGENGLNETQVINNLAMFFTQLHPWENKKIDTLLSTYLKARQPGCKVDITAVVKQLAIYRRWREKKYIEKKAFRQCSAFDVVKNWRTFCVFVRNFGKANSLNVIENADRLIEKGTILKSGRTATVAKIELEGQSYIIKRYNRKNWLHQIARSLMESRSAVSWRNGHLLTFNNIPTAEPLFMFENRWGVFRGRSYVITEYIDGVHAFEYFTQPNDLEKKEAMARAISALVNHLHQSGFTHGDLKAHNVWIAKGEPILIDLDGMKRISEANETNDDWLRLKRDLGEYSFGAIIFDQKQLMCSNKD